MKARLRLFVFVALLVMAPVFGANERTETLPPLPENVTLANGAVLRKISVVRWEKDRVVLKHAGGIDPVRYEILSPEDRKIFEARRAGGLLREQQTNEATAKSASDEQEAYLAAQARKDRIAKAILRHSLVVGMTADEAIASWGKPNKINASGGAYGSHDQWIYNEQKTYVYFDDGVLKSWQDER